MGVVGGNRQYDGPGLGVAPWKCPACAVLNTGMIDGGCASCGSGSAQARHVGVVPPAPPSAKTIWDRHKGEDALVPPPPFTVADHFGDDLHLEQPPIRPATFQAVKADMARGLAAMDEHREISVLAETWAAQHGEATITDAFLAGYQFAIIQSQARTMVAPPVTADLDALAPDGKARRTIIAALEIFKDQVLRDATEEIASGEWCSIEEIEHLITELKTQEGSL